MRTQFINAPGVSFVDIGLPAGQARGIIIDNPSGSWLRLYPTFDYIPPYTLQWSRAFDGGVSSLRVMVENGPAGQLSSTEGDDVTVYLDSHPVSTSAGVTDQFVNRSKQPEWRYFASSVTIDDINAQTIPFVADAPVGSRIRLLRAGINMGNNTATRPTLGIIADIYFRDSTNVLLATLQFDANRVRDEVQFSPPIDGPVRIGTNTGRILFDMRPISPNALPTVSSQLVAFSITYSVV